MEPAHPDRMAYGDTPESAILRMAKIIVERFSPMSVMLFGSRARGDADGHSDADLFVIMPEGTDVDSIYLDIRAALRHSPVAKDILVNTPGTFAKYAVLPGTVQRKVVREGMLLYGGLDSYAATLLQNAEGDLNVAGKLDSDERSEILARAYHSQQAAEKALKCALALSGVDFAHTHDLEKLAADLPPEWGVSHPASDLDRLSKMVITARYGNGGAAPSKSDADWAFNLASDIVRAIRDESPRRGT
ncbi:MAG: HEPN domain-containing protein [Nitrosopumilaceae archaeon]|nr:HEPN domain-containing protein [Nitrosopumilaceae archaeon]